MKKLILLSSALTISLGGQAFAATGNASVKIVTPMAISETTPLNFGSVINNGAGTVIVSASGSSTRTGTASVIPASTFSPGIFAVTGEGTSTYAITLGSTVSLTGPGTAMTASLLSSPSATGVLAAGAQTVYVGGTLTTNAVQTAGTYSGTYTITVAYN